MIKDFSNLLTLLNSEPFVLVIMFKSSRCPPCRRTLEYLEGLTPSGICVIDEHISNFKSAHNMQLKFMVVDVNECESLPNDNRLFQIASVMNKIRGVPTFEVFMIDNNSIVNIPNAKHVGSLNAMTFSTFLDNAYSLLER